MSGESVDEKRILQNEVTVFGNEVHNSEDVLEFFALERIIEKKLKQRSRKSAKPLSTSKDYDALMRKFDDLETTNLVEFDEDIKLLKAKVIFYMDNTISKIKLCQKIFGEVDLDKTHTSKRRNMLRAECSMIKAIIMKRKSAAYSPGSECSKLMTFLAEQRYHESNVRCLNILLDCPGGLSHLDENYNIVFRHMARLFKENYVPSEHKMKNAHYADLRHKLSINLQHHKIKELRGVKFSLDRMPGRNKLWIDLLVQLGAAIPCTAKLYDDVFYVTKDPEPGNLEAAKDIMDTTIVVILEDLMF